ncbi:MAG: hypothetical protein WCH09_04325 [Bacteroidota bacterium]
MDTKEQALEKARRGAPPLWMKECMDAIRLCATEMPTFTTDDIWEVLEGKGVEAPREPRAMGVAMVRAVRMKMVTILERTAVSRRRVNHGRRVQIWQSLLYKPTTEMRLFDVY